jgi:hypothetical protein
MSDRDDVRVVLTGVVLMESKSFSSLLYTRSFSRDRQRRAAIYNVCLAFLRFTI